MWSGSDAEQDAWLHIADMGTQKYPNIKIQFETTPFNDYWTKLTTEAASGKTPCVIGLKGQRAPQFGNLLVPLDDYTSNAGIKAADFVPSITRNMQYEGSRQHDLIDARQPALPLGHDRRLEAAVAVPGHFDRHSDPSSPSRSSACRATYSVRRTLPSATPDQS